MYNGETGGIGPRLARSALPLQSDQRLVDLVRSGCEEAFEEIVRRYSTRLQRRSARLVGEDRAQDVVQHTFVATHRFLIESDSDVNIAAWLFRTAHNRAIDVVRQRGSHYEEIDEATAGFASDAAEQLENAERTRALLAAIQELPEKQRDALVLSVFEGRTFEEVADVMDGTVSGVNQLMRRARRRLRNGLGVLVPLGLLRNMLGSPAGSQVVSEGRVAEIALGSAAGGSGVLKGLVAVTAGLVVATGGAALVERSGERGAPAQIERGERGDAQGSRAIVDPATGVARQPASEPELPTSTPVSDGPGAAPDDDERPGNEPGGSDGGENDSKQVDERRPSTTGAGNSKQDQVTMSSTAQIRHGELLVDQPGAESGAFNVSQPSPEEQITVSDSAGGIAATAPCVNPGSDPHTVTCPASEASRVVIRSGAGNDSIDASALDQGTILIVYAGEGNDAVTGSPGMDALFGGMGRDQVFGLGGADTLVGGDGEGDDAGDGDDRLEGGPGDDGNMLGGAGDDIVLGGPGDDGVSGGQGDDTLDGGSGVDMVFGEQGRDRVDSRDGEQDRVASCGGGDDLLLADDFDPIGYGDPSEDACERSD